MTEKEIQELVRNFNNRKGYIVPVIGEELLCYVDDTHKDEKYAPEGCISLQQYLVESLLDDLKSSTPSDTLETLRVCQLNCVSVNCC